MDPYQHVTDGTAYPATLFAIGLNDRRVTPWITAKMAARMMKATTSSKPVLVRIDAGAGSVGPAGCATAAARWSAHARAARLWRARHSRRARKR